MLKPKIKKIPPIPNVNCTILDKQAEVVSTICKHCLRIFPVEKNSEAHLTQVCTMCYRDPKIIYAIGRA